MKTDDEGIPHPSHACKDAKKSRSSKQLLTLSEIMRDLSDLESISWWLAKLNIMRLRLLNEQLDTD